MIVHTVKELGQQLHWSRKSQKIRQVDLAYMVGSSHVTVKNVEKGHPKVKSRLVMELIIELGLVLTLMKKGTQDRYPVTGFACLGALIVQSRKEQGLRQEDLAAIIGVSHVVLSRMERGDESVSIGYVLDAIYQLGLVLDVRSDASSAENLQQTRITS